MQLIDVMKDVFNHPTIAFDPTRQSLKAWAKYCLQNRGFRIVYAQNADFAIETNAGEKIYFKVSPTAENLDPKVGWIVPNESGQAAIVIPPQGE